MLTEVSLIELLQSTQTEHVDFTHDITLDDDYDDDDVLN